MRKEIALLLSLALAFTGFAQEPDKPAMEQFFMDGLSRYDAVWERPVPDNLQRIDKNLYVSDFGHYETEMVRAVSYFRKIKGEYVPLRDSKYPVESIATLLSGYMGNTRYTVHFKQRRYNYAMEEVDVSLSRLLGFCIMECSFVPYVGIENADDNAVKATLFLVNEQLGYSHTFIFTIDPGLLEQEEGLMQVEAYTFTPIHNLAR